MIPFTEDDILAAYAETGLKPISGCWLASEDGAWPTIAEDFVAACPITTVLTRKLSKRGLKDSYNDGNTIEELATAVLGMTTIEVDWFVDGFDGYQFSDIDDWLEGTPEAHAAFLLGRKLQDRLFPELFVTEHPAEIATAAAELD